MAQAGCCSNHWHLGHRGAAVLRDRFRTYRQKKADQNRLNFFDLPAEIRNYIYTQLVVDQDVKYKEGKSVHREHIGGILIHRAWPEPMMTGLERSSLMTRDRNHEFRPTTYAVVANFAFKLFYVSRQFYKEASYIFYTKNRFYADSITSLVLFAQDRPIWARRLIEAVSIPDPYGFSREGLDVSIGTAYRLPRRPEAGVQIFALACASWSADSDLLPNLKRLDLRVWELYGYAEDELEPSTISITEEHSKLLASVADPRIMTLSFCNWHCSAQFGYQGQPVFEPLPEAVCQAIERHRGELASQSDVIGPEA